VIAAVVTVSPAAWAAVEAALRVAELLRRQGGTATVGVVAMAAGLVVRVWTVLTLGRSFRTAVEVHADQAVVESGPYRLVRHPSCTGLLLIVLRFQIGTRVWPAILLTALPLAAVVRWITVEEALLVAGLGPSYVAYRARTRRLLPGIC
jgi:protein-S-isoprenylcysteine O-methyltransferase Ste14